MKVKIGEYSGFCFGVKRAINIANETLNVSKKKGPIYSLGPIIHNPQVVEDLSKKGVTVVRDIDAIKKGTVIVSSHGVSLDVIDKIKKKKLRMIDATCPFVKYAQDIVKGLKKDGFDVAIVGDKEHPEVKALLSMAGSGNKDNRKIGIVSQTTQSKDNYIKGILDVLSGREFKEIRIFNTICNDTTHRQEFTRRLIKQCDVMIVVGGRNSANTKRLWQICKESGVDSYHIENELELKKDFFVNKKRAGVVSGASTPDSTVIKVKETINSFI